MQGAEVVIGDDTISEAAKRHVVLFVAISVDTDGHPFVIGGNSQDADRQEVSVAGLMVFIQDHLFAGQ